MPLSRRITDPVAHLAAHLSEERPVSNLVSWIDPAKLTRDTLPDDIDTGDYYMHVAVFPGGVIQGPWVLSVGGMGLPFIAGRYKISINSKGKFDLGRWIDYKRFDQTLPDPGFDLAAAVRQALPDSLTPSKTGSRTIHRFEQVELPGAVTEAQTHLSPIGRQSTVDGDSALINQMWQAIKDLPAGNGVWFPDADAATEEWESIRRLGDDGGYFTVYLHSPNAGAAPVWNGQPVPESVLAAILKRVRTGGTPTGVHWNGQPLRFVSCFAAAGGTESYAASTARLLATPEEGVEIYAPTDVVWSAPAHPTPGGEPRAQAHLLVGRKLGFRRGGEPVLQPGGNWLRLRVGPTVQGRTVLDPPVETGAYLPEQPAARPSQTLAQPLETGLDDEGDEGGEALPGGYRFGMPENQEPVPGAVSWNYAVGNLPTHARLLSELRSRTRPKPQPPADPKQAEVEAMLGWDPFGIREPAEPEEWMRGTSPQLPPAKVADFFRKLSMTNPGPPTADQLAVSALDDSPVSVPDVPTENLGDWAPGAAAGSDDQGAAPGVLFDLVGRAGHGGR